MTSDIIFFKYHYELFGFLYIWLFASIVFKLSMVGLFGDAPAVLGAPTKSWGVDEVWDY